MVPMAALAALICVGIGVDFSGQTIAEQQLRDQAAHCAREGATQATLGAKSTATAVNLAYQCLSRDGLNGTVTLSGMTLTVDLSGTYETKLLTTIAINSLPIRGISSAEILQGR